MKPEWIVLHHYVNDNSISLTNQHYLARRVRNQKLSYHYIVFSDGSFWMINDPRKPVGHCGADFVKDSKNKRTSNYNSIGVCCMGNFQNGQMRDAQKNGLTKLLFKLCCDLEIKPKNIIRHRDVWNTACPGRNFPFSNVTTEVEKRYKERLVFEVGENKMIKGGIELQTTKPATMLWGVTIFPVRDLLSNLGYEVNWISENKEIYAESKSNTINLWVDKKYMTHGNEDKNLDHEVLNIWGSTVAPLRSLLENLDYTVNWYPESKKIEANKKWVSNH